jgi:hypothetical protein
MKTLPGAALFCLAAAMICGCTSRHEPLYHAGDENVPEFLSGPVAVVLTNLDGWSAEVSGTTSSSPGQSRMVSGEILERNGRLIFQPSMHGKSKKARRTNGLFFIWDENKHAGYVLSDALQGYAPIKSEAGPTTQMDSGKEGMEEQIDGHPCHRSETTVTLSDGTMERLSLWRAADLKHFPVRIEAIHGPQQMTLDLTNVRLESPSQELFSPPDGFTAYASAVSMMNELITRESALSKQYQGSEFDEPKPVNGQNWHQGAAGMQ